jgi:hypothetical protein
VDYAVQALYTIVQSSKTFLLDNVATLRILLNFRRQESALSLRFIRWCFCPNCNGKQQEGGEEECAYVVWIKSQPSLKAVSAGRSSKVSKERVVGRYQSYSTLRTAC